MSVGLADPIRMMVFSCMNTDKATNALRVDQKERGVVATLQLKNAASDILDIAHTKTGAVADKLNKVSGGIKNARSTSKAFDVVCKGVNVLSKLVNPILCVASFTRAINAEDKGSAFIKETGAMSAMFGAEWAYKVLFGLGGKTATYQNNKVLKTVIDTCKKFCATNKILGKLPQGQLGGLIKGLGFIAASCGAFEIGSKLGQKIANKTTAKAYAKKHPPVQEKSAIEQKQSIEHQSFIA